jgi:hypothetical protein
MEATVISGSSDRQAALGAVVPGDNNLRRRRADDAIPHSLLYSDIIVWGHAPERT